MEQRPIFTEDGYTFAFIKVTHVSLFIKIRSLKHNNLFVMCVTKRNSNIALVLTSLHRLINASDHCRLSITHPPQRYSRTILANWTKRVFVIIL
mmetsp:Transcript_30840/g.92427  ORF Transcript_30840/g.92427 Transcript_30840/m.92427 type:complete len:94 (-) Transcript_30840:1301-1582(-)